MAGPVSDPAGERNPLKSFYSTEAVKANLAS